MEHTRPRLFDDESGRKCGGTRANSVLRSGASTSYASVAAAAIAASASKSARGTNSAAIVGSACLASAHSMVSTVA